MAGERGANDLFEYIRQFILSPGMGYGYVFTNAMLIMAAVMLLRDFPKNKKGIAQFFIGNPAQRKNSKKAEKEV